MSVIQRVLPHRILGRASRSRARHTFGIALVCLIVGVAVPVRGAIESAPPANETVRARVESSSPVMPAPCEARVLPFPSVSPSGASGDGPGIPGEPGFLDWSTVTGEAFEPIVPVGLPAALVGRVRPVYRDGPPSDPNAPANQLEATYVTASGSSFTVTQSLTAEVCNARWEAEGGWWLGEDAFRWASSLRTAATDRGVRAPMMFTAEIRNRASVIVSVVVNGRMSFNDAYGVALALARSHLR